MVKTALTLLLLAATAAMANEPGYQLRVNSKLEGGTLTVEARITAPAGAQLRYEVVSSKQGSNGKSSSSQGGNVTAGPDGSAKLSALSVSVDPQDKYVFTVRVFDGAKLVPEGVLRYPQYFCPLRPRRGVGAGPNPQRFPACLFETGNLGLRQAAQLFFQNRNRSRSLHRQGVGQFTTSDATAGVRARIWIIIS